MSPIYIISIIALLIISSFIISAISYSRQQALKKRTLMVKRFVQQSDEALGFISLLLRIDHAYELLIQLQTLVVNALGNALKLNPDDQFLHQNLNSQKTKLIEYKENQRSNEVNCWLATDSELTATQSQLNQLNKLLDLYRNQGALSIAKHQQLISHIQKLKDDISTNSYLYQADLYGEQNNLTSYQLYIKQAIQSIKKTQMDGTLKNKRIKELSDRVQEVKRTGKTSHFENFIKPKTIKSNDVEVNNDIEIDIGDSA